MPSPTPKLRLPFARRRSMWEITESDLPDLRWRELEPRLDGLENNPVFRMLCRRRWRRLIVSLSSSLSGILGITIAQLVSSGPSAALRVLPGSVLILGLLWLFLLPVDSAPTIGLMGSRYFEDLVSCGFPAEDMARGIWGASLPRTSRRLFLFQAIGVAQVWVVLLVTSSSASVNPWIALLLTSYAGLLFYFWGVSRRTPYASLAACSFANGYHNHRWEPRLAPFLAGIVLLCAIGTGRWFFGLPFIAAGCFCLGRLENTSWQTDPEEFWVGLVGGLRRAAGQLAERDGTSKGANQRAFGSGYSLIRRIRFSLFRPRYKGKYQGPMWRP